MLVKLTYAPKGDKYAVRTVFGDPRSIWDLWWHLKDDENINLTDAASGYTLNPNKGIDDVLSNCFSTYIEYEPGMVDSNKD